MKKLLLLPLLLSFSGSGIAKGHPGDDVWDKIYELSSGISTAMYNIQQINNSMIALRSMIDHIPAPINYQAGAGIEIQGTVIQAKLYNQHQIGDEYRGGFVFYVDESGEHGLIASKIDVNDKGIQWRNGVAGNKTTNARGDGIGAGETNTRLIIASQTIDNQNGQFAALQAANFQVLGDGVTPCKTPVAASSVCYGGWYLPSAYELQLLHNNLHQANLSSFAPEYYWSSTEASVTNAWLQNFSTGEITVSHKANTVGRVRAISHF